MFDKCSQIMAYAHDVIMVRRLQDAEEVFTSLEEQTNKTGLEINEKKKHTHTNVMIVTQKSYNENAYEKLRTNNF